MRAAGTRWDYSRPLTLAVTKDHTRGLVIKYATAHEAGILVKLRSVMGLDNLQDRSYLVTLFTDPVPVPGMNTFLVITLDHAVNLLDYSPPDFPHNAPFITLTAARMRGDALTLSANLPRL